MSLLHDMITEKLAAAYAGSDGSSGKGRGQYADLHTYPAQRPAVTSDLPSCRPHGSRPHVLWKPAPGPFPLAAAATAG